MLPNQCLCQLTGEPLMYAMPQKLDALMLLSDSGTCDLGKRKRNILECSAPRKRLKVTELKDFRRVFPNSLAGATIFSSERWEKDIPLICLADSLIRRTASDISFIRARAFYARPNCEPKSRHHIVGLPYTRKHLPHMGVHKGDWCVTDVLNRLKPSYKMRPLDPATYCDPDPRDEARNARHLSKYIFPLQYRLSNVFTSQSPTKENYKQPDFTDRERDIQVRQGFVCQGT